jgi:dephospho-CoA kinase
MGMGKSTTANHLRDRGLPVVDTDDVARFLVAPGQPALREIIAHFGCDLLDSAGGLRRELLAARVFSDPSLLGELEAILHPRIRQYWLDESVRWESAGVAVGAVIIPLLFETDAASSFDAVICVACSVQTQHQRLLDRGMSLSQISQRLSRQWPVREKMTLSNLVVWTDVPESVHYAQIDWLLSHGIN